MENWSSSFHSSLAHPNSAKLGKDKYSKTSLNRPTMGTTLSGPFRQVVELESSNIFMGDRLGPK